MEQQVAAGSLKRLYWKLHSRISDDASTRRELAGPMTEAEEATLRDLKKVVIPIGSYRNLTTLIASIFSLHPQALVLNHAGERIMRRRELDFIGHPDEAHLEAFKRAAVRLAQTGRFGGYGGNILYAHAFQNEKLLEIYRERFGDEVLKPGARALLWKESMLVTRYLEAPGYDLAGMLDALPALHFILPIRDPIACARSCIRTGHWRFLCDKPDFNDLIDRLLGLIAWIEGLRVRWPERVILCWETDPLASMMENIAGLCGLDSDSRWIEDVARTVEINDRPSSEEDRAYFRQAVERRLSQHPDIAERLLRDFASA